MPRVLTAARVRVPAASRADYVATLRALSRFAGERGERIWVFQSGADPQAYLEFSESAGPARRPRQGARAPEEVELEARLHRIASYAPDARELWTEVPLADGGEA